MSISWEAYNAAQGRQADWRPNQLTYQSQQPQQVTYNQYGQPVYGQPQPINLSATNSIDTVEGRLSFDSVGGEMRNTKFTFFPNSLGASFGKITLVVPWDEKPHSIGVNVYDARRSVYGPEAQYVAGTVRSQGVYYGKDSQDAKVKWEELTIGDNWSANGGTFFDLNFYRVPSGSIYPTSPSALVGKLVRIPFAAISGRNLIIQWSTDNPYFFNGRSDTPSNLLPMGGFENPGR